MTWRGDLSDVGGGGTSVTWRGGHLTWRGGTSMTWRGEDVSDVERGDLLRGQQPGVHITLAQA